MDRTMAATPAMDKANQVRLVCLICYFRNLKIRSFTKWYIHPTLGYSQSYSGYENQKQSSYGQQSYNNQGQQNTESSGG